MAVERALPSAVFVCAMSSTSLTPLRQAPHCWRYGLKQFRNGLQGLDQK